MSVAAAARPLRRHQEPLRPVFLLCMRCGRTMRCETIARDCHLCARATKRVYGFAHPTMEMSGM